MIAAITLSTTDGPAVELAGKKTWRKQILRACEIPYNGQTLKFDRQYLDRIVAAFKSRYETIPFQLAGDDNSHTNAVDRTAGEITSLEATDDGLYATVSVNSKGAEILKDFPGLPVSVRLVDDVHLQHVMATWMPRVHGLSPWEETPGAGGAFEVTDGGELVPLPASSAELSTSTKEEDVTLFYGEGGKQTRVVELSTDLDHKPTTRDIPSIQQTQIRSNELPYWGFGPKPGSEPAPDGFVRVSDGGENERAAFFDRVANDGHMQSLNRRSGVVSAPSDTDSAGRHVSAGIPRWPNGDVILGKDGRPLFEPAGDGLEGDTIDQTDGRIALAQIWAEEQRKRGFHR